MWIGYGAASRNNVRGATIGPMLIDAVSASTTAPGASLSERAVASFLALIERRLGVSIVRDARSIPGGAELADPYRLAKLLRQKGIIKDVQRTLLVPDEPRMRLWTAFCNDSTGHQTGGASWTNEADAMYAALAEALERFIWFAREDYFDDPTWETVEGIARKGRFIAPERFSGYTDEQRVKNPRRHISESSEFRWIRGRSLVHDDAVYLPSLTVSGTSREYYDTVSREPFIRPPITIGLATWPTLDGARCAGANECLEREAYMVMWLNQLTLPRYSLASLREHDDRIARVIDACSRYRLKMHVIRMLTDAPTHAIAVVLEDESGFAPRFTIGIRANRSLTDAVLKAAAEALRARRGYRWWASVGNVWDPKTPTDDVGHRDRLYYWGLPENASRLEFLVAGPETDAVDAPWDADDETAHLARILAWCREKQFECTAVSLGTSPTNPTPFHVEMVVMPELQWTYLTESMQAFGGTRWRDIPPLFGYAARMEPFADEPHPYS